MSDTLNVNVLVAAKEEYTKQLISSIQPEFYTIIKNIYVDSQRNNLRRKISYSNFQRELKGVPDWTSFKLDEKLKVINSGYPYLMDLVTAIFVSHVKILACVRLKREDKSVKIKVPNLNSFLHKILIKCSEYIYYEPEIIQENKNKILEIIVKSINETVANQIPIEYILSEYLSGVFDEEDTKYPEKNEIVQNEIAQNDEPEESDEESDYESEGEAENKNIPIIPIQKPITKQIVPGTLTDDLPFNKEDNKTENTKPPDNIEEFNDLKNNNGSFKINKREDIDDDSEEEFSDEEDEEDEEEQTENIGKEPTLF